MATILVTGGAGYVGSHACKALARAGHVPVTYDSLERGHRELVKWGPLEQGDIHDAGRLAAAMGRHGVEAVMHFASYIFVDESVAKPDLYAHNIVEGTRALIGAMARAHVRRIVVSSSAAVYGLPATMPIRETEPCRPINPYGRAKLEMEGLLRAAPDLHWTALRYFNAAGADPEGETGEWHEPETHLIPRILDVALGRGEAITINGTDYPTPDGTCVRDYIHVTDLIEAHLMALSGDAGGAFNLGTGGGCSVREIIETARRVTGRPIAEKIGPRRAGDPAILVADASLATNALGWTPRRGIADQIADAWRWHQRLHGQSQPPAASSSLDAV